MDDSLPRRPVTDAEVEAFWRDGVVCLRQILPPTWIERMAGPVSAATTTDLSGFGDALAAGGAERVVDTAVGDRRGRFKAGTDHWRDDDTFLAFATRSPLGPIVARILRSERVWLYEDSVLVKEPGTQERTAWHQDLAYFHLAGERICTTWVPLDPVTGETGAVRFVTGSHLDRTRFRPGTFVTSLSLPGTEGAEVPDYDRQAGTARIVSFDTEPGDLTIHHARTIHGAAGNASANRQRRAISVRYAGEGTTFVPVAGAPTKPHHEGVRPGDELDAERFPLAWPRPEANPPG